MTLFIIFVFGAVILGTGALLAPAWPTAQPRIGLAAALALGLVVGGALFYAMLFGWDTLVVDYLLFALVTTIFLLGTLTFGQRRAEARGVALADFYEGWPGPRELLFFGFAALIFIVPTLMLPVPLDTDAQGFGYLALMARLGGGFDSLAPFRPEIHYLYAPGFTALAAYLSHQLGQPLHLIQFSAAAVLGLLNVWLAYDLGCELRGPRLGRATALAMLAGTGLFTAYMDSHFTSLLALVFAQAFITYALRFLRDGLPIDAVGAGLMLGAVVLSHPDTTIIVGLGYAPWLLTMWLGKPRPTLRRWLTLAAGVPLLALVAISPWLWSLRPLLGSDIVSPFVRDPAYWQVMVLYHGVVILIPVIIGAVFGLRSRDQAVLLAVGWLALVLDFAAVGLVEGLIPGLAAPLLRYDYPFSIAWHGPIIPYALLGGMGLLWLWDRLFAGRLGVHSRRYGTILLAAGIIVLLALPLFGRDLLALSKGRIGFYGAFASHDDVRAMDWLRQNTAPDARVLNYPAPHEGDWVPVIAERDSVYYRPQPFFRGDAESRAEQEQLRAFWANPADPDNATLLEAAGIDYVIVPQVVANPDALAQMYRWRAPFAVEMASPVEAAPYLELVFDASGARVYQLAESFQR